MFHCNKFLLVYGCFAYILFAYVIDSFTNVLKVLHVVLLTSCKSFFE